MGYGSIMIWLLLEEQHHSYKQAIHGRDSTIFDDRKSDKKGLLAFVFPLARDKEEESRAERGRKLSFWETFLRLFSNSVTWREKSFTGNPFLLTFLPSKRAESLP